jgi:hypothetical protein
MLTLTRPSALWLMLVLAPIVVLYFLRMRFRRQSVGSIFIWKSLVGKTSGGTVLRARSLLLLFLQASAVALGALAASGPVFQSKRILKPGTVFLVDLSASMACDDAPGYSDRAQAAARAIEKEIDALGPDEPAMLFACASRARPLLAEPTLDKAAARGALRSLKAGSEAFSEADCADDLAAWTALRQEAWRACLATDGGLDMGARRLASVFDGALRVVAVGGEGESIGVAGLRVESGADGGERAAFSLWNGFGAERTARVVVLRDGAELGRAALAAAPGWSRAVLPLNRGANGANGGTAGGSSGGAAAGAYTLRVERAPGEGGKAPGAECYLAVYPERAVSVLLVGRDDPYLKAALAYGGIAVASSASFPEKLFEQEGEDLPDLVISEAASVPDGLRCNLLSFGALPPEAPARGAKKVSGPIAGADSSHPLSRFVDWAGAATEGGLAYRVDESADVVATIGGLPVIVAWQKDGYRFVACGIDLAKSDLGLKSAFPILLQNFIQWCVPRTDEQSAYTLVAGEAARRAEPPSFRAEGARVERDGPIAVVEAGEAGLFSWERRGARGALAVNVPLGELDVAPRGLELAGPAASPASAEVALERPLRSWVTLLFLACLAAEWLLWRGLPSRKEVRS